MHRRAERTDKNNKIQNLRVGTQFSQSFFIPNIEYANTQALVEIINEVRRNASGIPQDFDFTPFINVELET